MNNNQNQPQPANGKRGVVYRRFIRLKNGRVLDAHKYGHKAWPIGRRK